jgi:hypothetical protein
MYFKSSTVMFRWPDGSEKSAAAAGEVSAPGDINDERARVMLAITVVYLRI